MKGLLTYLLLLSTASVMAQNKPSLKSGTIITKSIRKGERHNYSVHVDKGGFFEAVLLQRGVDVVIDILDPSDRLIASFDSPNGINGPEPISFYADESGNYQLDVYLLVPEGLPDSIIAKYEQLNKGDYILSVKQLKSGQQYKQYQKQLADWLKAEAHPLKAVTAGNGFEDLQWLKPVLKDVKYVGLGEATHGTREFFQMKHRMLEFLVKEMDYTVFAIEASYAGCKNINDYVMNGKGDAHAALASQGFWVWDTEEVIDMIEWIHDYNLSVPDNKKVQFHGFDIQVNVKGGGAGKVQAYLQDVDPEMFLQTKTLFTYLDSFENNRTNTKDSVGPQFSRLLEHMVLSRGHYIQASSIVAYEDALYYATVISQYLDAYLMADNDTRRYEREWRDYYMASNFNELAANLPPDTKIVLWAHNGHISKNVEHMSNGGTKPFGSYLAQTYGKAYFAMGFLFNKGGFQSMEFDSSGKLHGLQEFLLSPARENSLEWQLTQAGKNNFIVNFRQDQLPGAVKDMMEREYMVREFGSAADRSTADHNYSAPLNIGKDFDALIFIDSTTRARPTKTGMRPGK